VLLLYPTVCLLQDLMHVRERRAGAFRQCQVHGTAVGCRADRSDALNSAWLWWCAVCSCRPVGLGSATHGERCLWRWSGRICGQAWTAATAKARGYPAGGLATILSATSSRFIPVSLAASGAFGLSDRVCFLAGAWLCGWQLAVFLHKCSRTALTVAPQHPPGHGRPPQCRVVARRVPLCLVGVHLVPVH